MVDCIWSMPRAIGATELKNGGNGRSWTMWRVQERPERKILPDLRRAFAGKTAGPASTMNI
jgi:hypothetical protein